MPQLLFPPFYQFLDDTPVVLENYRVFFYESGTTDKLDTYSDSDLTVPNANPVTLNSEGRFPQPIFGENRDYKVVVALPASEDPNDPPTTIVHSQDPVRGNDLATFMEMKIGSGTPSGNIAGTQGSAGVVPTGYWDFTNNILYFCTTTGDAANALWTAINASAAAQVVPGPQGYLTPVSSTPVIAGDATSVTAIYYTPDQGNLVPIYNGSQFVPTAFTELTLNLSASHVANSIYDVFAISDAGVLTLVTGPAWTTVTAGAGARGVGAATTELSRVSGFYAVTMNGRNGSTTYNNIGANRATFLGSINIDGSAGQVTCHRSVGQSRKWGVWNAYNRRRIILQNTDATATWTYNTATLRPINNNSANKVTPFIGLAEEPIRLQMMAYVSASGPVDSLQSGIGINSTTVATVAKTFSCADTRPKNMPITPYYQMPFIGINAYQALEKGPGSGTITWSGGQEATLLTAEYLG
jgi:hypothetical protein